MRIFSIFTLIVLGLAVGANPAGAGFGFSEPHLLNLNAPWNDRDNFLPEIATNGQGTWICTWYSANDIDGNGYDTDIFYARSTDEGQTWSFPQLLNSNARVDEGFDPVPRTAWGPTGVWICTWSATSFHGGDFDIIYSRSFDDGVTWEPMRLLNTSNADSPFSDLYPVLTPGAAGEWIVTWQHSEGSGSFSDHWNPMNSRSTDDSATWSTAAYLNSTSTFNTSPGHVRTDQATDGNGNWVIVWSAADSLTPEPATDRDIFLFRSSDGGATWSTMQSLDPDFLDDQGNDGYTGLDEASDGPVIRTDGKGVWIVVYASTDARGGTIGDDSDILFSRSTNLGETWSVPSALNSNAAHDPEGLAGMDISPALDVDAAGNWVCAWATTAFSQPNYSDLDVAVSRSTDAGITWSSISPPNLNSVTNDQGNERWVKLVSDKLSTWMLVCQSSQPLLGNPTYRNIAISVSRDIGLPPSPYFCNSAEMSLIANIVLGHLVLDVNGDGKIDVGDMNASGVCKAN